MSKQNGPVACACEDVIIHQLLWMQGERKLLLTLRLTKLTVVIASQVASWFESYTVRQVPK